MFRNKCTFGTECSSENSAVISHLKIFSFLVSTHSFLCLVFCDSRESVRAHDAIKEMVAVESSRNILRV